MEFSNEIKIHGLTTSPPNFLRKKRHLQNKSLKRHVLKQLTKSIAYSIVFLTHYNFPSLNRISYAGNNYTETPGYLRLGNA